MRQPTLRLEDLHARSLPSATLAGGVLSITGTEARDVIVVRQAGDQLSIRGMKIDVDGTLQSSVSS